MLKRETETTGISSLKIGSNNVYGYYIEVRNTHKDKVPDSWIRKQTLVNAERYITEELKEYEAKILGAEEKILHLEQLLFSKLVIWMIMERESLPLEWRQRFPRPRVLIGGMGRTLTRRMLNEMIIHEAP